MHRRYDLESGKPLNGRGADNVPTSEFFQLKHIPEITFLPATNSAKSRCDFATPTHKSQGTSLRELQRQRDRKRSSSAPPRSTNSDSTSSGYLWQKAEKGTTVPISRFASTPLAQYIAMRQNISVDSSAAGRLHASELNSSSIASSATMSQVQSELDG